MEEGNDSVVTVALAVHSKPDVGHAADERRQGLLIDLNPVGVIGGQAEGEVGAVINDLIKNQWASHLITGSKGAPTSCKSGGARPLIDRSRPITTGAKGDHFRAGIVVHHQARSGIPGLMEQCRERQDRSPRSTSWRGANQNPPVGAAHGGRVDIHRAARVAAGRGALINPGPARISGWECDRK